jgi:predicted MFS family arabinose efflux permease
LLNPWRGLGGLPRESWVLFAATLVNRAGTMALPFLVLYLTRQLGYTATDAGFVLAVYGASALLTAPVAGRLADRVGPLRVMKASLLLSGLVLFLFPFARGAGIHAMTALLAATTESFRPANLSALSTLVAPEQRRAAFALNRLAVNLGMSIGPALGGLLAQVSFPAIFRVDGATSVLAAALLAAAFRRAEFQTDAPGETTSTTAATTAATMTDAAGSTTHATSADADEAGSTADEVSLTPGEAGSAADATSAMAGEPSGLIVEAGAAAGEAGVASVERSATAGETSTANGEAGVADGGAVSFLRRQFEVFADPQLAYFLAALLPILLILFQNESVMPLFLTRDLGMTAAGYGLMFTINTALIILLEVPLNTATAHWPHSRALATGSLLFGLGFGALALVSSPAGVAATVVVWTFGEMILLPASSAYVADIAREGRRGEYMGLYTMSFSLAFAVAPWVGTTIYERHGARLVWLSALAGGCLSALLMTRLRR